MHKIVNIHVYNNIIIILVKVGLCTSTIIYTREPIPTYFESDRKKLLQVFVFDHLLYCHDQYSTCLLQI